MVTALPAADPATEIILIRGAAALFGLALGASDLQQALAAARDLPGGVDELADRALLPPHILPLPDANLAAVVIDHLGLRPAAALAAGPLLVAAFESAGFEHRGRAVLQLLRQMHEVRHEPLSPFFEDARLLDLRVQENLTRAATPGAATQPWRVVDTVALTAGVDQITGASGLDTVVTGVSIGPLRTLSDRDVLNTSGAELRVQADAALGALPLPALWGVERLTIESRAAAAGGHEPLRVSGPAHMQRVDLARSQVDVELALSLPDARLLQEVIVGLVETGAGVAHRVVVSGLSAPPTDFHALHLQLMDVETAVSADPATAARPLKDMPFNGFSFRLGGQLIALRDEHPQQTGRDTFNGAQTYADLLQAVQQLLTRPDHLERWPLLAQVHAELGPAFDARSTITGATAQGRAITLRVDAGSGLTLASGAYIADDGVPASTTFFTAMQPDDPARLQHPVATVVLDAVGAGGAGSALAIGAADADPLPGGVGQVDLVVERDSMLTRLEGLRGDLEQVNARSGLGTGSLALWGADARLTTTLSGSADFGLVDVRVVDLSALAAPATVDLALTVAAAARYTDAADLAEGAVVRGGAGADRLAVQVDAVLAASPLMRLHVTGAGGDDELHLLAPGPASGAHAVLTVDGGPGNDTLVLSAAQQPVRVVVGASPGHDRLLGFGSDDAFDFTALGGLRLSASLSVEPLASTLRPTAGDIVVAPAGAATADAAGVAARFITSPVNAQAVVQLYLAWSAPLPDGQQAQVWRVTDAPMAGAVSAELVGSLTLVDGAGWGQLPASAFGG